MFLWKTDENYPSIIIKYPPYLFHFQGDQNLSYFSVYKYAFFFFLLMLAIFPEERLQKHFNETET